MNFVKRITFVSAIGFLAASANAADPVISLSSDHVRGDRMTALAQRGAAKSAIFNLDFVAGEKGAAVVQFDVVINGSESASIDLSKCGGTVLAGSDHRVYCNQIAPNRVRVLVDSPTNAVIPTATFGTISVSGGTASIDPDSAVVGDPQAVSMSVEVL